MRILALHPRGTPVGGGELVAAWMLQALKCEHRLSVLAWEPLDLGELNRFYGTTLREGELQVIAPRRRLRAAIALSERIAIRNHDIHRYQLLMRECRRLRGSFDLAITGFDEADLGRPGIQYVHAPWTHYALGTPVTAHRASMRLRPWMLASGFSVARMRANLTLANSRWSAAVIERTLGIRARVLTPPVPGHFRPRAWEEREDSVVVLGRFVPEKRIEMAFEVVRLLREQGQNLRLHVIGSAHDHAATRYAAALRRRAAAEPWVQLHEDLSRAQLIELLCRCRYGLHPNVDEPFGIAVAEMVRAGCIPLTRRSGGVVEIFPDERLRFESAVEAADRLRALIVSAQLRSEIRARLERRAGALAPERFVGEVRSLVAEQQERASADLDGLSRRRRLQGTC